MTTKNGTKATDAVRKVKKINTPVELSTGVRVIINVPPAVLIEQAASEVKVPQVPEQELEDGRKVQNPNHPDYLQAIQNYQREQYSVGMDVMIAFVDLPDGLPEDDSWIKRLKYLERLGRVNLGKYDLEDELDREFVYKRFVAFGNEDLELLTEKAGISEEDRRLARESFRSDA